MSNTENIPSNLPSPTQDGSGVDLQRLVSEFEYRAKCCEQEVAKAQDPDSTLFMSDCEVEVYEQAARTYRHCIDLANSNANAQVRHLDLFSGIGGFALAAEWVGGIETIGFCEIDPWAQKVLNKNFPGVSMHDDVKTLDPKNYGRIDLITGGYPCQPFSVAGKQRGTEDDRHLWPEVFRIIKAARPRWVLCENVAGHINMGLDEVLSDLASEGYAAEAIVIPACAVDAHHRRDRVWIVGNSKHNGSSPAEIRRIIDQASNYHPEREKATSKPTGASMPARSGIMANSQSERCCDGYDSELLGSPARKINTSSGTSRHLGRLETGRWKDESGMDRVADGLPDRVDRIRGLGNAIVPQVAAEILRTMMTVDSYYPSNVQVHPTAQNTESDS